MRKPSLEDFGLNEDSLNILKSQEEVYRKECESIRDYNNKIYKEIKDCENKKFWSCLVAFFIPFAILMGIFVYNYGGSESPTSTIVYWTFLGYLIPIIMSFITAKCFSIKINQLKDLIEKDKNKFDYIDKNLSEKLEKYRTSLISYNNLTKRLDRQFWENLTGFEFEEEVAIYYRKNGYYAEVTKKVGDGGVDIILYKGNYKFAVQCKHFNRPVGPAHLRELKGVLENYDDGVFVSLNGYTETARAENSQSKQPLILLQLEDIIDFYKNYANEIYVDSFKKNEKGQNKTRHYVELEKNKNKPVQYIEKNNINVKKNNKELTTSSSIEDIRFYNFDELLKYIKINKLSLSGPILQKIIIKNFNKNRVIHTGSLFKVFDMNTKSIKIFQILNYNHKKPPENVTCLLSSSSWAKLFDGHKVGDFINGTYFIVNIEN